MNRSMQISVPIFFQFFWVCTEEWNAGSYGASVFNLCAYNGRVVFHNDCTILHPDQNTQVSVPPHPHLRLICFLHNSRPNGCEAVSPVVFAFP